MSSLYFLLLYSLESSKKLRAEAECDGILLQLPPRKQPGEVIIFVFKSSVLLLVFYLLKPFELQECNPGVKGMKGDIFIIFLLYLFHSGIYLKFLSILLLTCSSICSLWHQLFSLICLKHYAPQHKSRVVVSS